MLTGLTSAMYLDESDPSNPREIDSLDIAESDQELGKSLRQSGLYIKARGGSFVKVDIPKDCIAFQIGEVCVATTVVCALGPPLTVLCAGSANRFEGPAGGYTSPSQGRCRAGL